MFTLALKIPAGLKKEYAGVPLYFWIAAAIVVLGLVAYLRKKSAAEIAEDEVVDYEEEGGYVPGPAIPFEPDNSPFDPTDPTDDGEIGLWDMQSLLTALTDWGTAIQDSLAENAEEQAAADERVGEILEDIDEQLEENEKEDKEKEKETEDTGSGWVPPNLKPPKGSGWGGWKPPKPAGNKKPGQGGKKKKGQGTTGGSGSKKKRPNNPDPGSKKKHAGRGRGRATAGTGRGVNGRGRGRGRGSNTPTRRRRSTTRAAAHRSATSIPRRSPRGVSQTTRRYSWR